MTGTTDRRILDVPHYRAPEGMCSEGAIQMVLQYYGFEPPDQEYINREIDDFIWTAKPFLSKYLDVSDYGPASEEELYEAIDRGNPVFLRLIPDGQPRSMGHTVVLTGHDLDANAVYINDTAFDGPNHEYTRNRLMREWGRAGRGTMFVYGRKGPSLAILRNGHNYIGDGRISLQGGRMMIGINIRKWAAGAVRPAEDSPAGFIWFKGTIENNLPIPMTGVVGFAAVSGEKSVSGKQRMTMGGSALKILGNTKDFTMKVDVPDIGAQGDRWKATFFSGNLLGNMPVYKKDVEMIVVSMMKEVKIELVSRSNVTNL